MIHLTINNQTIVLSADESPDDIQAHENQSNYIYGSEDWGSVLYREINTGNFNLHYFFIAADLESQVVIKHDVPKAALIISGLTAVDSISDMNNIMLDLAKDNDYDYFPSVPFLSSSIHFSLQYGSSWSLDVASKERRVIVSIELSTDYLKETTCHFFRLGNFYGKVLHHTACTYSQSTETGSLKSIIEPINNLYQDIDDYSPDLKHIYANNVCESVFLLCVTRLFLNPIISSKSDINLLNTTKEAAGLLTDNLKIPSSIYSLQRKMGVNGKKIRKGFKLFYGINTQGYLNEKRLEKAVNLLLNTKLPLLDIALEVGYAEQDSLIKLFKRKLGCTPGFLRI